MHTFVFISYGSYYTPIFFKMQHKLTKITEFFIKIDYICVYFANGTCYIKEAVSRDNDVSAGKVVKLHDVS